VGAGAHNKLPASYRSLQYLIICCIYVSTGKIEYSIGSLVRTFPSDDASLSRIFSNFTALARMKYLYRSI